MTGFSGPCRRADVGRRNRLVRECGGIVRHIVLVIVKIAWDSENGIRLLLHHLLYEHQASDLFKKEGRMPGDGVYRYAADEYIGLQQFPLTRLVIHELRQSCDGSCFDV